MGKRRRERDRPKVPPDAMYNPNKRVHLSYADSDDEADTPAQGVSPAVARQGDVQDEALPPGRPDVEQGTNEAYNKPNEQHAVNEDGDSSHNNAKYDAGLTHSVPAVTTANGNRERHEQGKRQSHGTSRRTTELLSGCIEIPANGEADDSGDGSDQEVARYIKSVQTQRSAIPQILSAADPAVQEHESEGKGVYDDGAYVARDRPSEQHQSSGSIDDTALDPQTFFTARLLQRFHILRAQMHTSATMTALSTLGEDCLISFPPHNKPARKAWRKLLHTSPPETAQVQSLDEATALRLLDLIQETCMPKRTNLTPSMSAWIWALLARLDEVSNMYNDDVYPLRQLGKKALFVHLSFANPDAAAGIEALEGGTDEANDMDERDAPIDEYAPTSAVEAESGQHRTAAAEEDRKEVNTITQISDNTAATLDMILTVVGEVFGQRDLLQFRQSWKV